MCGCESPIMEMEFDLADSNGKSIDFQELNNIPSGEVYQLYKGQGQRELVNALGDKWGRCMCRSPAPHTYPQSAMPPNILNHMQSPNSHIPSPNPESLPI